MFKTSGRASFLIILFQFLQYYVFVVLSGDVFAFFFTGTFIATPSPEKKIAYKTFFVLFFFFFVLRFYGPVNPVGSCRARSVYLTTRLLGRLSPLSG